MSEKLEDYKRGITLNITLGPLLGIENEYAYTVCFLLPKGFNDSQDNPDLSLKYEYEFNGEIIQKENTQELIELFEEHVFYRFAFQLDLAQHGHNELIVQYSISLDDSLLQDDAGNTTWRFAVPASNKMPKIGFLSCNGLTDRGPEKYEPHHYNLWGKLRENHDDAGEVSKKYHVLVMDGDQVYADSMWQQVPILKKYGIHLKKKSSFSKKLSNEDLEKLKKQLAGFYENLYIKSWAHPDERHIMASVPSVMMWDDHEIFDGWGSHGEALQQSQLFQTIYSVAKRYFAFLQIRGNNKAAITSHSFTQRIPVRNVELLVLDNRSHRTSDYVMDQQQYADLKQTIKDLFNKTREESKEEKHLVFVIPVPVAHLDYSPFFEWIFRWTSIHDDLLDKWDHYKHKNEQKKLLDIIFSAGQQHNVKYLTILSGDVHTAGGATITKIEDGNEYAVTQLISSPMMAKPPGKFANWLITRGIISNKKSQIAGYDLELKSYGPYEKKDRIYERNFSFIAASLKRGIPQAYLWIEGYEKNDFVPRNLRFFRRKA